MLHEYYPEEYIRLAKELNTEFHPKLAALLNATAMEELDMRLAHVAAYCEVALDGTYSLDDRRKLCDILFVKLVAKREVIAPVYIDSPLDHAAGLDNIVHEDWELLKFTDSE